MTTANRFTEDMVNTLTASLVFLLAIAIYTVTLTPTVPFWDGGEYIATSYILGVPHPPGTPLYVLVGRFFTLIPFGTIAQRVNWLSAFSAALTILFTYLITVKFSRRVFPLNGDGTHRIYSYAAGVVAAFMAAFATTFWDNAIEAEVYAAACALMTFAVWIVLRWFERLEEGNEDGLLLIVTYLVGLGVGIHLGVAIAAFAAVIFVFVVRPRYLREWDYVGWAIVTLSLGLGVNKMTFLWAPLVLGVTIILYLFTGKLRKLAFWSSILFMLGLSVHLFLTIRAGLDPAINEGAPKDLESLWLMLIRDQYKPPPLWQRKTDLLFQFDHMWFRYMRWNFSLAESGGIKILAGPPLVLAAVGAVAHVIRDRRTSVVPWVLFLFLGPAMVIYLNFSSDEVRERDYFFVQNFQFMAIWVGLGAVYVVDLVAGFFKSPGMRKTVALAGGALFVAMSLVPIGHNWFAHDRRGFYLAQDFAHNMLDTIDQDGILFTNGDNDTFSLWYAQEVEGYRKDVRVVNLSLLNTPWYIRQLRDFEPKVPISFTDAQIDQLRPYRTREGAIVMVRDLAVQNIVGTNAWRRTLYIGVTVPDQLGLDDRLVMEGLAFRVSPEPTDQTINLEKARRMVYEEYRFRGLLDETKRNGDTGWEFMEAPYKGPGPPQMVQNNYAGLLTQVGLAEADRGRFEEGDKAMANAMVIAPNSIAVALGRGYLLERQGRWDDANLYYVELAKRFPTDWRIPGRRGLALVRMGRNTEAVDVYESSIAIAPTLFEPYQQLLSLYYSLNDVEGAINVMSRWLERQPNDPQVRPLYDHLVRTRVFPGRDEDPAIQQSPPDSGAGN